MPFVPAPVAPVAFDPGADDAEFDDDDEIVDDGDDDVVPRRRRRTPLQPLHGRLLQALGGLLIVVVAFGGGIAVGRVTAPVALSPSLPAGSGAPVGPSGLSLASLPQEGPRLGNANAKVTLTYWADYQCPYCARFGLTLLPQLAPRIADGTLAVEHRDYAFLGAESYGAAVAVRCAGRVGKYWAMHDAVYTAQNGENQGAFVRARLLQIAASVGLDAGPFTTCLDEHAVLVDVLADTSAGIRSGVTSTPTMDVNGTRFLGVSDVAALLKAIDAAAAGATPAPMPTPEPSQDSWTGIVTSGREAGSASAPVTVELWMDYQATDSAAIARDLEPELQTRITADKVRVVLRDLATLGDESVLAATAVRCVAAEDQRALFTSDVLAVSAQGPGAGIFTVESMLRFVARLGMDVRSFDTCLADPSVAAAVKAETAVGTSEGLKSAPAVVVSKAGKEVARFSGTLDMTKVLAAVDAAGG